ncbi:MAG: peptide deformylase [Chitinophagales bacterium]
MILPIIAYGNPVLRKVGDDIPEDYPKLKELVANMFETMYNAKGVGLAGPQVGLSLRIFVADTVQILQDVTEDNDFAGEKGIKKVFINAEIVEESGDEWMYDEGCLSIPNIQEGVSREETVRIQYYDEDFNFYDETYSGFTARVIQHEYDHIEGILFTDYLSPLKKRMMKRKLEKISKGDVEVSYRMKFNVSRGKKKRKK